MCLHGILCLDKPAEMTSFSCCAVLRHLLGVKKVGHAGTLDPMATGVLTMLVGNATRALDFLPEQQKRYTAHVRFGAVSDTLDVWGHVTDTGAPPPAKEDAEAALQRFRGDIMQVPPMVSALKQNGVRLYDLARQGQTVERKARPVTVSDLTLLAFDGVTAVIDCTCSKGTYIRSIIDDWGQALGCGAIMTALRRTEAVGFTLQDTVTLNDARLLSQNGTLAERLIPVEQVFTAYPALTVSDKQAVRFQNGGALSLERLTAAPAGLTRVYSPNGKFLGLGTPRDGELAVARLFSE